MNQEELIQSLQERIKELENEREEFTNGGIKIWFSNKATTKKIVRSVKPRTLRKISKLSLGDRKSRKKNLVIEGDNLWAMVTLYQYHGKVDLIITDPPYNTGKDFRYNDKWDEDPNDEGLGDYVSSDDTSRHTKWMKFMLPRIQMMQKMLKPGGVLAICIDYRELFHLGKMLDEVFGEKNRLGIINWQKSYSLKAITGAKITSATDYVLVYAKSSEKAKTGKLEQTEEQKSRFSNPDNDPKGEWRSVSSLAPAIRKNLIYAIQNPFSGQIYYPLEGRSWRYQKSLMRPLLEEWGSEYEERDLQDGNVLGLILKGFNLNNLQIPEQDSVFQQARKKAKYIYENKPWPRLIYLKKGFGKIRFKLYFAEVAKGISPLTWWDDEEDEKPLLLEHGTASWPHQISGHSQAGTAELKARIELEGDFVGVKPLKLFTKIFQLWGYSPKGGICFDPFAGSGTTGEIISGFNKELRAERERERAKLINGTKPLNKDKSEWQFILVEQGFNPKEEDKKEKNWCRTILQKRLKAVITGQWADGKEHEPLGGGFQFLSLDKPIDEQTLLKMERKEIIEAIFASQISSFSETFEALNFKHLIAKNKDNEGVFLIWNGNGKSELNQEIYYQIVQEAKEANLSTDKYRVLVTDLNKLNKLAKEKGLPRLKAIYVCKTNLLETETKQEDNLDLPFEQRKIPSILIWRHLVEKHKINPHKIAVCANIKFKKPNLPIKWFNLFDSSSKKSDYQVFLKGSYEHIIFNKSLLEGWDDPLVYMAYIDRNIGGDIQANQLIGRVLRMPKAHHYESDFEDLNTAFFHIKADSNKEFKEIMEKINKELENTFPGVKSEVIPATEKDKLILCPVRKTKYFPNIGTINEDLAKLNIQYILQHRVKDYSKAPSSFIEPYAGRTIAEYKIGLSSSAITKWEKLASYNKVSVKSILRRNIININPRALDLTDFNRKEYREKLKFLIGINSQADKELKIIAQQIVNTFMETIKLITAYDNCKPIPSIGINEKKDIFEFEHSIHQRYSGLNPLEEEAAKVIDGLGLDWARNPVFSGYGIPLLSKGTTRKFYPDFLVWLSDDLVVAIETTGREFLRDKLDRKIFKIESFDREKAMGKERIIPPSKVVIGVIATTSQEGRYQVYQADENNKPVPVSQTMDMEGCIKLILETV